MKLSAIGLTAITSIALLAGCASSPKMEISPTGTVIPAKRDSGGYIAGVGAKTYPDVQARLKKFTDRKIAVPYFTVNFDKKSGASARDSQGFGSENTSSAHHVNATLTGVSEATFGRIADAAYADLLAQLSRAGFQVVPANQLKARGPLAGKSPSKAKNGKKAAVRYGGTGVKSSSRNAIKVMKTFKAAVLDVHYALNFAAIGAESRAYSSGYKGSTSRVGQVAHALGYWTVIGTDTSGCSPIVTTAACASGGRLELGQYTYSTTAFATIEETTKGWANFISALIGGASMDEFNLVATDAKYEKAALEALREANKRLVKSLKSGQST